MSRNGNFCKGTRVSKIIVETKVDASVEQQKKFTGFSHMSVMANLLRFGCFAAGQLVKEALFPTVDLYFYQLA